MSLRKKKIVFEEELTEMYETYDEMNEENMEEMYEVCHGEDGSMDEVMNNHHNNMDNHHDNMMVF